MLAFGSARSSFLCIPHWRNVQSLKTTRSSCWWTVWESFTAGHHTDDYGKNHPQNERGCGNPKGAGTNQRIAKPHIEAHFLHLSGCHPSPSVYSPAAYGSFWYIHDARSIYTSAAGESVYSLSDIPILPRVFSYFTRVKQSNFHKRENTLRAIKVINNLTTFFDYKSEIIWDISR